MAKKSQARTNEHNADELSWPAVARTTKDTIESIVIAFILAFVFRAFIVEAYRIPTGSMAPTLYGAHQTVLCPDCGYRYAIEASQQIQSVSLCPNCRYQIDHPAGWMRGGPGFIDGGDRILVMKLGYELGDIFPSFKPPLGPHRWDAVVFKNPANADENYIKRLIGLPGEKIEIIDGDIYINDQIARKTPIAARSLWFLVYDNDYPPARKTRVAPTDVPGWLPADAASEKLWETASRVLAFSADKRGAAGTIAFNGPAQNPFTGAPIPAICDYYGYDEVRQLNNPFTVSDLKMEFLLNLRKASGPGQLDLVLSKRDDVFVARLSTIGKGQLYCGSRDSYESGKPDLKLLGEGQFPAIEPMRPQMIAFENVDYRVRLTVGDKVIVETTDQQYHPQVDKLRAQQIAELSNRAPREKSPLVRITARDFDAQVLHLVLRRDVYYRPVRIQVPRGFSSPLEGQPGHAVVGNPMVLGPHDYFVLGDNSPESLDSRLWFDVGPHLRAQFADGRYRLGTVPADQMVGRAFFVYWPAGFRLFESGPPLIPNAGEMRFIR